MVLTHQVSAAYFDRHSHVHHYQAFAQLPPRTSLITQTTACKHATEQHIVKTRDRLPAAQEKKLGVEYAELPRLLAESDFVSLHATNIPSNRGLVDAKVFSAMKPGAFFINTARGPIVDEDALYDALTKGTIAGAGLDVHVVEPRPTPDKLATLPNVILTPHIAGGSRKGVLKEIDIVLSNCRAVLAGQPIQYQVSSAE